MHKKNFFIGLIIGALIAGTLSFIFYRSNLLKTQEQYHQLHITRQAELIDSIKRSDLGQLMNNVLEKIDDEVSNNPKRKLSEERIASIVALCYLLKPYSYDTGGDSISNKKLSPERGQILLMLLAMNIDSVSFQKIILQASFAGAVLREADLRGADLKWVDLSGADLQDADLQGANLSEANFKLANLWGANLKNANLIEADLTSADVRWANLNEADLNRAKLNKADLSSAQLRKADLRVAFLQRTDLSGAFLNEANLSGADLLSIILNRANLRASNLSHTNLTTALMTEANLIEANLTGANLNKANLTRADLTNVVVSAENWLTLLNEWNVTGASEILSQYKLVSDSVNHVPQFRLIKMEN